MKNNFKNGFQSFSFHESAGNSNIVSQLNDAVKAVSIAPGGAINPEDTAKMFLQRALAEQADGLKNFVAPAVSKDSKADFRAFQTETMPFTNNKNVKFRQTVNGVSVYGSVINVEIDPDLNLVSINSSMAPEITVNTVAKISPEVALKRAADYIKNGIPASVTPLLYLYFEAEKWKLVYLINDVVSNRAEEDSHENKEGPRHQHGFLNCVSVIVDAESGEILKQVPRAMSLKVSAQGDDEASYNISVKDNNGSLELIDEEYNVRTYDLNFGLYWNNGLPGSIISQKENNWLSPGVNAHFNACRVAQFLRDTLKRNGIDNKGMPLISTVRCVEVSGNQNWMNAAWLPLANQMVYGQTTFQGKLRSLAISLDVVAHEILHGVTRYTSNLDYHNQSGALNESYSDIFGIIISNHGKDVSVWNWELGEQVSSVPFRDLSNPSKHEQPEHMNDYQNLPDTRLGDWGGVHTNSGIHNKAAYNLITSKATGEKFLFNVDEVAALFYMALIQLSNRSGFGDSYRGVVNAANSFYRSKPDKQAKLDAIKEAFESVGISQ